MDNRMGGYVRVRAAIPDITFELAEGSAVELISFDSVAGKVHCHAEALEVLTSWTGSIALVINFGQQATGKTSLLNRVLDLDAAGNCFPNGGGMRLWTKPLFNEEENLNTYFIDVQGCDQGPLAQFCWQFAFLLGSIALFSTRGGVGEAWRHVAPLQEGLNRLIISEDPAENAYSLAFYAPTLIWLLKDAQVGGKDERGLALEAGAVFEAELHADGECSTEKRFLRSLFKDRDCFCFAAESVEEESLKALKERIYSQARPKMLEGFLLTPRMTVSYVYFLVEHFNAEKVVDFGGLLDAVLAQECEGLLADALQAHALGLERISSTGIDTRSSHDLFAALKLARQRALECFQLPAEMRERLESYDAAREKLGAQISAREEKLFNHFRKSAAEFDN